ncbi:hypothetical protein EG328_001560 [Venturia inaequalis]|uniref:Uncharacterized protein n=1 Tax=Venturia inaequalis TaxID=5025 RepID=A0A8H3YY89_VENIN|nr:hypothetical protein EG328_001560 [Venturia inaequalis]
MNGNATPWASTNMNPIRHSFYGEFQSRFLPTEQYPYPPPLFTSPVHSFMIPPPDVVSRERLALAVAMERRAAAREARNTSPTAQQEPPAEPSTQPFRLDQPSDFEQTQPGQGNDSDKNTPEGFCGSVRLREETLRSVRVRRQLPTIIAQTSLFVMSILALDALPTTKQSLAHPVNDA